MEKPRVQARSLLIIGFVLVGGCGLGVVISRSGSHETRFEAHEYAVFRSKYERLQEQNAELRADHFRDLLEQTESSMITITPAMGETLAEFLRKVVNSENETPEVKAEASLVLHRIERGPMTRAPASESASPVPNP